MLKKFTRLDTGALNKPPDAAPELETGDNEIVTDLYSIRVRVQQRLEAQSRSHPDIRQIPQIEQKIETYVDEVLAHDNLSLTASERQRLLSLILADILGYGPLESLLNDESITEVMVNKYNEVYIERGGLIEPTKVAFENEAHLMRIIERMVAHVGRRVDQVSPMVNARLPAGYRLNAIIRPLAVDGPVLTIRKFARIPYTAQDLINNGTLTSPFAAFLKACVEARVNMVISGATGTGKTTMLNVASSFIPARERIVTIEDTAELKLNQAHVIRLEARPPSIEEKGEITIRQLLINALRMRPDRIIVGEARGGEALDMLQAMNTGHDGSLTTIHSNSPRDTLRRIELMTMMAGLDLSPRAIREMIASAIELVVHLDRLRDGSRKVVQVSEVNGMEGDVIRMTDLFAIDQSQSPKGQVVGMLKPTGLLPKFDQKFVKNNVHVPKSLFTGSAL